MSGPDQPVFRFAPSPNGRLHLGHAYSALLNQQLARQMGGRLLLRIEDTDLARCTPVLEARMLEDLEWLGIEWEREPFRQSDHLDVYEAVLSTLEMEGLVYPAFMSRGEIRRIVELETQKGFTWPKDPDGAPHYPDHDRLMDRDKREELLGEGALHAKRLDMAAACEMVDFPLHWHEDGEGPDGETGSIEARPLDWGDIVLSGKQTPAAYHLASVVDDALSGVTHIVRGRDLFWSTSVHRLLQKLLGYPAPYYLHHDLVLGDDGQKLSKSQQDTSLAELRLAGASPDDIRKMVGLV